MKNSYPTEPIQTDTRDIVCLNMITLGAIKQCVDANGIQVDMTMKPDGLRLTLTKKYPDKTIRKRQVDIDNGDYASFQAKFMSTLQELLMLQLKAF